MVDRPQKQSNNGRVRAVILAASVVFCATACKTETVSPAFASPSATIDTLFRAYDVQDVPQAEIRRRMQAQQRFELKDERLFRSCFSDWQGDHDQGLGGFVFGQLAAAKDELEINVEGDTARVRASSAQAGLAPVVLVRLEEGWKIDLRKSVPPEVRQHLYELYRRARRVERKAR